MFDNPIPADLLTARNYLLNVILEGKGHLGLEYPKYYGEVNAAAAALGVEPREVHETVLATI